MPQREKPINVRSMFGHNTQRGLVMLRLGEEMVQMEPAKAREIAHWILEAAEAAEQDEALVLYLKGMGLDERDCARALQQLRAVRGQHKEDIDDARP